MIIQIKIEKETAKYCSSFCPFRKSNGDNEECTLFNEVLPNIGYWDSRDYEACWKCQQMFEDQKEKAPPEGSAST